ncbi:MAG: copper amine oxidase N-terminal domain-containing protein [Moorellaceae bacterium]
MSKKWLMILGVLLLVTSVSVAAFAAEPIKLVVNGKEIKPDVPLQMINNRVMAPVRWIAEVLGCAVDWNEETGTVSIFAPSQSGCKLRVELLEEALAPNTPREALDRWVEGVRARNGALQYAVLSPELKKQKYEEFESCGWITGTSSPWVENCEIIKETQAPDGSRMYEVKLNLMTSTGPAGSYLTKVNVKQYGQHWFIDRLEEDRVFAQLEDKVTELLKEMYEQHYLLLWTSIICHSYSIKDSQVEALFGTTVGHELAYDSPSEVPWQKGRIKFLEENRDKLTPEQVRKVEEQIAFWEKELNDYIREPQEANMFFKVMGELNADGNLKPETVKFYYEDPMGNYLPFIKEQWDQFKSAAELEKQGYEEMRQMVEQ